MKFLHTMVRVTDIDASLDFYVNRLGLTEVRRKDVPQGRYTLVFLAAPGQAGVAEIELTYNWDPEAYGEGRNFGHLAFEVDDIYATCHKLQQATARPATATWPSSVRPTTFPLNCCRRAPRWRRRSRGCRCRTPASGEQSRGHPCDAVIWKRPGASRARPFCCRCDA